MTTLRHRGFTLIELMVALVIGLSVIFGVGYAYVNQRVSARAQRDLLQLQSEAQLALRQIGVDVRQAGYIGCNSNLARQKIKQSSEVTVVTPAGPPTIGLQLHAHNVIRMFGSGDPNAPPGAQPDSHVLEVRYANSDGASMLWFTGLYHRSSQTLIATKRAVRLQGEEISPAWPRLGLLSDCSGAVIVPIASAPSIFGTFSWQSLTEPPLKLNDPATCGQSLVGANCVYVPSATLWPIRIVQYYVEDGALYSRTRKMTLNSTEWNPPQLVLKRVVKFVLTGIGLDGINDSTSLVSPLTWSTQESLDASDKRVKDLLAADELNNGWDRVTRLDLRLSMKGEPVDGNNTEIYRDYSASFTVRARVSPESTR